MKLVVCVKETEGDISPFDQSALECALQIPQAEITVLCMGRETALPVLTRLTRLGNVQAQLICDPVFAGADTLATSYALSLAVHRLSPDLVFCGRQSMDGDTAQVGPCLSAMLGFSLITNVLQLESVLDNAVSCQTRFGKETAQLPALLTLERGYQLRFPSIRARAKEVEMISAAALGADPARCGLAGSPTRVLKTFESNVGRRNCQWILPKQLPDILAQERQKRRQAETLIDSAVKLDHVWVVGNELAQIAKTIAKTVRVFDRLPPKEIAGLANREHPSAILWPADLWGRKHAPIAAALLNTGLCADCIRLETDGSNLFLYRPAYGGTLTAKIVCQKTPQMATVRLPGTDTSEVVIAVGRGALPYLAQVKQIADRSGYLFAASRAVVDAGAAPYLAQVGLTGKSVSPTVYLAIGISGAVQHTCAIQKAGCIIAVNPDRDARMFDFADYGVLADAGDVLPYLQQEM